HAGHQARTRPVGQRVERGQVRIVAFFAVAGEVRENQALVYRAQLVPRQMELRQQLALIVGHENIGSFDEPDESLVAFRTGEIECDAFFVPPGEYPAVVQFRLGSAGQMRKEAPQISSVRAFDLEHFRAEIRHHRSRGRPREISAAVDHPDSRKDSVIVHSQTRADPQPIGPWYTSPKRRPRSPGIARLASRLVFKQTTAGPSAACAPFNAASRSSMRST